MEVFPLTVTTFFRSSKNGSILTTTFSIRELISNGCDAITKLKKLEMMGEYTLPGRLRSKNGSRRQPGQKKH